MVKPIVTDILFLQQKSEPATKADKQVMRDLLDTLQAHKMECAGLAANMIGVRKNIIAVNLGMINMLMVNPVILSGEEEYETEEGCLSLPGERKTKRFRRIQVKYQDQNMKYHTQRFGGWVSEIIQHEIDHCNGILI